MASRFIQAAIPTYKESYVPLPLEFINKQITQDQAGFDKGAAEIAALSSLKQNMSPWAEEQGYRDKLMNPYLAKINELSNQLYSTGQVGQVVPQIAKLNQQWTNDEQRLALEKDYEFYNETYLPWTKSDKYSASFDELRQYQNGVKTEKWNPNIDIKTSSGLARIEGDQDAYVSKQLDNFVASGFQGVSGKDGIEIVMVGGVPQIRQTIPGTTGYKVIDPSDKMYGHYYEDAIQNVTDAIMSGQDNPHRYYKGVYNQGDEASTRAAIEERVRQLASTRYFKTVENTPERVTYNNLPADGSGGSGGGGNLSNLDYTTGPYGAVTITSEGFGNIEENIKNLDTGIKVKYDQLFNSSVDAFNNNPTVFTPLHNELEKDFDNIMKSKKGDKSLYENIDNVKAFAEMPTNERYNYLEKSLGKREATNMRNKILSYNLKLAEQGTQDKPTQDYLNRFFSSYSELNDLEAKRDENTRVKSLLYSKGYENNKKEVESLGLKEEDLLEVNNIKSSNGFIRHELGNNAYEIAVKEEYLPYLKSLGINVSDYSVSGSQNNDPKSWMWRPDYESAFPSGDSKVGYIYGADLDKLNNIFKLNAKVDKDIKAGNITLAQDEYIKENDIAGDNEGTMFHFLKNFKDQLTSSKDPQVLIQLAQYTASVDPSQSHQGNIEDVKKLFDRSVMKEKEFEWTDGKMEYTDVKFRRYSSTSLPSIFVTVNNSSTDKTSTAVIHLDKNNKSKVADMVPELLADEDPIVNAIGAEWYGAALLGDGNIGKIRSFFDITPTESNNGLTMTFKGEDGNTYTGKISKAIDGKFYKEFGLVDPDTKEIKPLATQKNSEGQILDVGNVKNSFEALQIIGFYNYGKAQGNSQWSSGGNSDDVGKSDSWTWTPGQ